MAAIAVRFGTALAGDTASSSFEGLFQREYATVVAIARRILFDTSAAEDVAQDVFMSFHRRHSADAPYARRWLHVAAAHAALNVLRGRKRRARREIADALLASRGPALATDPAAAVADADTRARVRSALAEIGTRYASVLALRHAGLSYAEVASALHLKASHVGTLLRRAELALKKEFEHGTPR